MRMRMCVCVCVFRLFFRDSNTPDRNDVSDNVDREICPDRISREFGAARHKR